MHLFIIRHEECLGQIEPEYDADPDSPLSPRGEAQARAVSAQLRGEEISHILSSPLLRSLETAQVVAEVLDDIPVDVWMVFARGLEQALSRNRTNSLATAVPTGALTTQY